MKITIDQDKCIACGACYSSYPELFEQGEDNKSQVKSSDYKSHGYEKQDILAVCPVEAITIED